MSLSLGRNTALWHFPRTCHWPTSGTSPKSPEPSPCPLGQVASTALTQAAGLGSQVFLCRRLIPIQGQLPRERELAGELRESRVGTAKEGSREAIRSGLVRSFLTISKWSSGH